ncbi:hypothetical protein M758_1G316600 [Ceratodon purpureus]|nr:hypothetical protein M758_1G316600 [Ceratodon purpureus]
MARLLAVQTVQLYKRALMTPGQRQPMSNLSFSICNLLAGMDFFHRIHSGAACSLVKQLSMPKTRLSGI